MIIFSGAGRLGNQIFQLYFLESIRKKNEKVLSISLGQVIKYFQGFEPLCNTENIFFIKFFNAVGIRVLKVLGKLHIISTAIEMHNVGFHKTTKGFLPITFAFGFVQTDKYIQNCPNKNIRIKTEYLTQAQNILAPYSKMKKVFIHARHGDYSNDIRLPDDFYMRALKPFSNLNTRNTLFIFLGDDVEWSKKMAKNYKNALVSKNSLIVDFALMQLCDGGVISNSTFAWCAAYFSKHTLPIIAPKFWTSFKTREWYPKDIATNKFEWIDVEV